MLSINRVLYNCGLSIDLILNNGGNVPLENLKLEHREKIREKCHNKNTVMASLMLKTATCNYKDASLIITAILCNMEVVIDVVPRNYRTSRKSYGQQIMGTLRS
jgi:hypothetical protein